MLFYFITMYAVFNTGGKQYRAEPGDTLEVERLDSDQGQSHSFDQVLLISNEGGIRVGNPVLEAVSVEADILEHFRGPKKLTFKMRRRKGYRRTIGHRQELTRIKIKEIIA